MATDLLQQAVIELEKLPPAEQDAVATRLLDEIKDDKLWAASFEATSDEQWDHLAASVKREIAAGDTVILCKELEVYS